MNTTSSSTLLFLCTGNYYRSRFAEILFNHRAAQMQLPWRADSRGIAVNLLPLNSGPISMYTIKGLQRRGIPTKQGHRNPMQLSEKDLAQANLIIALKEAEHRPLLIHRFPDWVQRIEFWHIHDLDGATPEEALPGIECEIERLLLRLSQQKH